MHERRIELGQGDVLGLGRVADLKTQDAVFESGSRIDRGEPVIRNQAL